MPSPAQTPRLSDEQLQELVALLREADSVELKLTIPNEDRRTTVLALGMDPLDAILRQVYFFDTPELDLDDAGVFVRARRTKDDPDDSVVKLRPVVPETLPVEVRNSRNFAVEVDAMPGGYVCSGSFEAEFGGDAIREVALRERPPSSLFSKKQRAFFDDHAPEGVGLDDLAILGPLHVLKLKFSPEGYGRDAVAELWLYPDGAQILELSTKCRPEETFEVAAESRAYLAGRDVNLSGEQETKTRTALEFFARELRHAG
jgi:hypothetical protein